MRFVDVYGHFVTKDVFEPVNALLAEAEGRGERKVGLEIDVPVMPNNGECRVRMRLVLVDSMRNILACQAFVDDLTGKWVNLDFSDDDGHFLADMLDALESLGDVLIANGQKGNSGEE